MVKSEQGRTIRSFVRREGRLTRAQSLALEKLWPHYGISYSEKPLLLDELFGRRAPLVVDIGVGTGDSTLQHALMHPENNYLAIEVHRPGVGHLLNQIDKHRVRNIRIINNDVVPVLQNQIPSGSVSQIFIFFPDPWPKKRHHKRRLINHELAALLQHSLARHGRLNIATDWLDYAEHIETVFKQQTAFKNLGDDGGLSPRPAWRIKTKYENRGTRLEHDVYDFCYCLT